MKTTRQYIVLYSVPLLLIAFILCIPAVAYAGISVRDTWAESGRLAIEGLDWAVVFSREEGALLVYSRTKETVKIVPFYSEARFYSEDETGISHKAEAILSYEIIESKRTQVGIKAAFAVGENQMEGSFFFDQRGTIHIKPSQNMGGFLIFGEISFGIVPSPPLEDLIYDPEQYPSTPHFYIPSENLFMGLLDGEDRLFFCAWPDIDQRMRLILKDDEKGERRIEAVEMQLDGKSAYLRSINTPGIWHREELHRTYLARDVEIDWQRPFPARWRTQLLEGKIETTFYFAREARKIWRPNFGFYNYPVWFEEDKAFLHLGKKVPPRGQALIYALEEHRDTPVDFARAHFGSIPTLKPRKGLRRYPLDSVGIQNCDGRAWVKWIFKVGFQTREKDFLQEAMSDFIYSINVDQSRLDEYERFIPKMKEKMGRWTEREKDKPELSIFLSQMKERIEELEAEYWDKMYNSPASEHLKNETEVINQLKVLINEEGVEVYPKACFLLDKIQLWSDIEAVPGRVGGLLRELYQQAGYACAGHDISVVKYAQQIRRDIREFLITGETHETIY